jgi:hypothetical protein
LLFPLHFPSARRDDEIDVGWRAIPPLRGGSAERSGGRGGGSHKEGIRFSLPQLDQPSAGHPDSSSARIYPARGRDEKEPRQPLLFHMQSPCPWGGGEGSSHHPVTAITASLILATA